MLAALAGASQAQTYPDRSIRILVTIPPGGAPDIAARLIGQQLSEVFGQAVVIENRSGANGNIAAEVVAKSPPDGYTLLLAADSLITINPHVYAKLTYDPLKDFVLPVTSAQANQFLLAITPRCRQKLCRVREIALAQDRSTARLASGGSSDRINWRWSC